MSTYTNLKSAYTATLDAYLLMEAESMLVDGGELSDELLAISTNLSLVESWITEKEEAALLSEFLAAQKALMVEYGMVIDVVEVVPGFGEEYGGTESAIRFSIAKDGVVASKTFDTISVDQSDIV